MRGRLAPGHPDTGPPAGRARRRASARIAPDPRHPVAHHATTAGSSIVPRDRRAAERTGPEAGAGTSQEGAPEPDCRLAGNQAQECRAPLGTAPPIDQVPRDRQRLSARDTPCPPLPRSGQRRSGLGQGVPACPPRGRRGSPRGGPSVGGRAGVGGGLGAGGGPALSGERRWSGRARCEGGVVWPSVLWGREASRLALLPHAAPGQGTFPLREQPF